MTDTIEARPARKSSANARRPSPGRPSRRASENRAGYAFLAPWLLGFIALTAGPMAASAYLAFTDYHTIRGGEWIGFDNFERLFDDPLFMDSVWVTVKYAVIGTPIKLAAALGVAMLLNNRRRGQGAYRSLFYAPSLIGASVSIAIVWRAIFNDDGAVDNIGQVFGLPEGGWIGNPDLIMPMMVLLTTWQFGAPMVIFLAGLKQIPNELYEAAQVDGAGPLRRFTRITLPMLSPVLFFNLVLETIHSFQVFGSAYIIAQGGHGPDNSLLFYTLYLYESGFGPRGQLGYAAAMAWLLVIAVGIITLIFFRTSRYWVYYAGEGR
ncbi:carbohydrate ABC transporter permease [Streptomyces sp. 6N223]|uniref:carbohydrate ABC transporter permease n=1 Tax=Streptomyces sp. 6N223 TaxID=3457412 RepID=UPI003FD5A732